MTDPWQSFPASVDPADICLGGGLDPIAAVIELLAGVRPAWHADAACLERPDLDFFTNVRRRHDALRLVCATCLVRSDCLAAGIAGNEEGIWGGLDQSERRTLRRTLPTTSGVATDGP